MYISIVTREHKARTKRRACSACSLRFLEPYAKDPIALTDAQVDDVGRRVGKIKNVFEGRLYLTLQDPTIGLPLSSLARKLQIPMVVTHPVYYLTPEQEKLQRTLTAIRLNQPFDQLPPYEVAPPGAYFTSQEEMVQRFSRFQPALERTQEIAERCNFDLPLGVAHMPKAPLPNGLTQTQYLRQKVETGALRIYGTITPEIQKRLDHELDRPAPGGAGTVFECAHFQRCTAAFPDRFHPLHQQHAVSFVGDPLVTQQADRSSPSLKLSDFKAAAAMTAQSW